MSTKHIILIAVGLLALAALIGCSDDDCASCPEPVTPPLGTARAFFILAPSATFAPPFFEVTGHGEVMPNLDSMKVGDSLIDKDGWMIQWPWEFAAAGWTIQFVESGDTSTFMYHHGDMATITLWGEGRSSSCRLRVLFPESAQVHITEPLLYADTIAPGGSDTLFWNKVNYVDYYAIMIAWYLPSIDYYTFEYYYATDTSFVITEAIQPDEITTYFNVHVTPFNGPDPRTGATNWDGTLLDGAVCSFGRQDYTTIVFDQPLASTKPYGPEAMKALPEISAGEIIDNVYKKYGK